MEYINKEEIVETINEKREKIYAETKNIKDCIVSLYDEYNNFLAKGINYIGNPEYGNCIELDREFTIQDLNFLTIETIEIWLNADYAILEDLDFKKTLYFKEQR